MDNLMRHILALLAGACVVLAGCGHGRIVRDAEVYRAELDQYDRWAVRQAALLRDFVASECTCVGSRFDTGRCSEAADWLLTVEARHAWHRQMALFNAGLLEERPAARPPAIPPSTCPLPPGPDAEDPR
jgi:hypothetical protein